LLIIDNISNVVETPTFDEVPEDLF